jgi:hypothetical protein
MGGHIKLDTLCEILASGQRWKGEQIFESLGFSAQIEYKNYVGSTCALFRVVIRAEVIDVRCTLQFGRQCYPFLATACTIGVYSPPDGTRFLSKAQLTSGPCIAHQALVYGQPMLLERMQ